MDSHAAKPDLAVEISKALIQQVSSEVGLLISLSLAICGGLLLLILQTLTHNHDRGKHAITFSAQGALFWTLLLQGLSVCFGLLADGAITAAIPEIFTWWAGHSSTTMADAVQGTSVLRITALSQWIAFVASLITASIFIFKNRRILGRTAK
jgi:hypothetical protein